MLWFCHRIRPEDYLCQFSDWHLEPCCRNKQKPQPAKFAFPPSTFKVSNWTLLWKCDKIFQIVYDYVCQTFIHLFKKTWKGKKFVFQSRCLSPYVSRNFFLCQSFCCLLGLEKTTLEYFADLLQTNIFFDREHFCVNDPKIALTENSPVSGSSKEKSWYFLWIFWHL